jgi:hypothetical protein
VIYDELDAGDLDRDFNLTTGLGNPDTAWFGWAIADGRNSTKNRGDVFPLGYKQGTNQIGATGGTKEETLTISTDTGARPPLPEYGRK